MPWRKLLFWSSLAAFSLLLLVLGWLWAGDLGVIKPHVERWVSEKTGRELTIDELSIDLGAEVFIIAEGIRFADADWTGRDHMATVDSVAAMFELRTLLNPPFIIGEINVTGADVFLTKRVDDMPNWALDIASPEEPPQEKEPESNMLSVLVRNTLIQNVSIRYEDPAREAPVNLVVSSLNQTLDDEQFLVLVSRGSLSAKEYEIKARAGSWGSLLSGKNVGFDIEGRFDTVTVAGNGVIDDLFKPLEPTASFEVGGPDIDDLTRMLGLGNRSDGSIAVTGKLETRDQSPMLLTLHGDIGETSIDAKIEFVNLADFSTIDADVRASGPNLGAILALGGITTVREAPFLLVADLERMNERVSVKKAEMVFGDTRFNLTADLPEFPSVNGGNAVLDVKGPDIERLRYLTGLPGAATGAFSIAMTLAMDEEQRELFDVAAETSLGTLKASGEIKGGNTFLGSYADIDVELFNVKGFADSWKLGIGDLPADALRAEGSIEYVDEGIRTRRPVAASLGSVNLTVEGLVAIADGIAGTNLLFEASGDQLRDVTNPFTEPRFIPPLPFAINGHMLINPGEFRFTDIEGTLGSTRITSDVSIRPVERIAGSTIQFSADGDQFEELTAHLPDLQIRPGSFELGGKLGFTADSLELETFYLKRPRADLTANLSIGLPASRELLRFSVRGEAESIQTALTEVAGFKPADIPWSLTLDGERNGSELRINQLDATLADASGSATGTLEFGERLERTDFNIQISVPDMSRLGTYNGRSFSAQALAFGASVVGADREIRVDNMVAELGGSDVNGAVSYRFGDTPYLKVDIQSDALYFEPLLAPLETIEYEAEPARKDGRLIPDIAIPFDSLAALNGKFDLDIADFRRGALYLYDVNVDATLTDGMLAINDVTLRSRSGYLRARAELDPAGGEGNAKLAMVTEGLAFGLADGNAGLQLKLDSRINVEATGNDLRTLLANTNGIVFLRTTGGQLGKLRFLNLLYGDMLDNIFSTINPFLESDPVTNLDCIVFPIKIVDGATGSDPASFVRTDKINIAIKSEINLASERLDINVRSTPRKILSISAAELVNPYIKIVGTMARPSLAVDEQGVLITGGAAVATGGLSLLARAAWDRLSRAGDPCKATFEAGVDALTPQFPDLELLEDLPDRPAEPQAAN